VTVTQISDGKQTVTCHFLERHTIMYGNLPFGLCLRHLVQFVDNLQKGVDTFFAVYIQMNRSGSAGVF
jgi:hypothetical protein